jgi:hypothetical protein
MVWRRWWTGASAGGGVDGGGGEWRGRVVVVEKLRRGNEGGEAASLAGNVSPRLWVRSLRQPYWLEL